MKTVSQWMLAAIVGLGLVSYVIADQPRDAGSKARGDVTNFWVPSYSQSHAQDHARSLYYYGQDQQPVAAPVIQEHVTAIRQNLNTCQKGLEELKKANPDNKEAQTSITKIETIHKKVLEHCSMLDKEAKNEKGDSVVVCDCCADMHHELDEAKTEMGKLQKALKIEELPVPAKRAPKK